MHYLRKWLSISCFLFCQPPAMWNSREIFEFGVFWICYFEEIGKLVWVNLLNFIYMYQNAQETGSISFKSVLHQVPTSCGAALAPGDISVHLCFICLLHLANEHNLSILDCPTMDELYIGNVASDLNISEVTTFWYYFRVMSAILVFMLIGS